MSSRDEAVVLLRDQDYIGPHEAGETINVPWKVARRWVEAGIAEYPGELVEKAPLAAVPEPADPDPIDYDDAVPDED